MAPSFCWSMQESQQVVTPIDMRDDDAPSGSEKWGPDKVGSLPMFAWCGGVENTWKYPNPSKSIQILHRKWWIFGKTSIWGSIFSCFLCGGPGSQRAKSPSVADLSVRFHPRWKKFCTELPEMRRKKSRKSERNGFGYSTRIYQIGSLRVSMAPNFETNFHSVVSRICYLVPNLTVFLRTLCTGFERELAALSKTETVQIALYS